MRGVVAVLIVAAFTGPLSAAADDRPAATGERPRYTYREVHDPNGIGKFYMGREIAYVMGHQGAGWLERPERVKEERTDKLLKMLSIQPGMVIADIGAGSGYFTFPMAKMVGARGKVLAVDIQKEMLDIIRRRMKVRKLTNIEPIRGTISDPKLPEGKVDLILMVDVYHEFSHPEPMLRAMRHSLAPDGVVALVEYRAEDPEVPIKPLHKMSKKQILKEYTANGFKLVKEFDSLPWQHLMFFGRDESFEGGVNEPKIDR